MSANYIMQGNIVSAAPFCEKALGIRETHLAVSHFLLGSSLHQLATIKLRMKKVNEAEMLWRRALAIHEEELPPNHPQICAELNGLAQALNADFRYKEAAECFEKGLTAADSAYPKNMNSLFASVSGLGLTYIAQREFGRAEPHISRALVILRESPDLLAVNELGLIENLITSRFWQGKLVDAIALYPDQARAKHTADFSGMIRSLENLVEFLQKNVLSENFPDNLRQNVPQNLLQNLPGDVLKLFPKKSPPKKSAPKKSPKDLWREFLGDKREDEPDS
jgi:tetratricopeptide (TPR) repeat protein